MLEPWGVGWDLGLMGLDLHVSSGFDRGPDEVKAWEGSPNAHAFIDSSSRAWAEAATRGSDSGAADAWAQRVTSFYTGTGE
jgi:hypothetical protein